jgi:PAS domain S-box-containing protein
LKAQYRQRNLPNEDITGSHAFNAPGALGIGDAVIATDRHGNVIFLNPVAETLTGTSLEKAKGQSIEEVFPIFNEVTHLPAEDPVKKVVELGCAVALANHTVLMNRDGTLIPIEDSAAPIVDDRKQLIGVVLVFRDATKERKAQEVLRKTEKLASAARLAASVAHELDNPLEAITNLIYLANNAPETPPPIAHHLTQAEEELKRMAAGRDRFGHQKMTGKSLKRKGCKDPLPPALVQCLYGTFSQW